MRAQIYRQILPTVASPIFLLNLATACMAAILLPFNSQEIGCNQEGDLNFLWCKDSLDQLCPRL